jgi:hypothetical protein
MTKKQAETPLKAARWLVQEQRHLAARHLQTFHESEALMAAQAMKSGT